MARRSDKSRDVGEAVSVPAQQHGLSVSPVGRCRVTADGSPHDWHSLVTMPDDDTQTLADVIAVMRENNLARQAAFVEWLADGWYDAKQVQAEMKLAANATETRCAAAYRLLRDARTALTEIAQLRGGLGGSLGEAKFIARNAIERISRG